MAIQIDLTGKTAAITGGGRGIGKAVALTLAKAGANVWIGSRKEEQSKETVKEIQNLGFEAGYSVMDVSKFEDMQRFLDDAEKFGKGKLDILVNNAGIVDTSSFLDITIDKIKNLMDINVIGVSNALQTGIQKNDSK